LRTVALPFLFIFNTDLLLINVGWIDGIFIFIVATIAMLLFAAGTQGYFFARSRKWESALLILIAFTLFRPGFFLDYVQPPFVTSAPTQLEEVVGKAPVGSDIRIVVSGPDFDTGLVKDVTVVLPVTAEGDGATRMSAAGLTAFPEGEVVKLDEPFPGTPYFETLGGFDFYLDEPVEIKSVQTAAERMPKQVFYIPALILLALVIMLQRRRQTQPAF